MTWESQDPAAPQDPNAPGAQPPPPGYAPAPGQAPPPGYQPPPPGYGQANDQWQQQPPPPYQQSGGVWQPPPAFPLAPDAYPVNVSYDRSAGINRLWGIPLIGATIRFLLLIPHFLILILIALIAGIMLLFSWIPVLILGRFPGWGYRWVGGLMGWWVRLQAYMYFMTSKYPPFSLSAEEHPINVRFDEGVRINRLWGIPILGWAVRFVLLIPHFIALWLIGIVVSILIWFVWVPVLILGRQADLIYTIVGGYTRWGFRVAAYLFLMVDRYPPFSLGEDDPHL
jgi:hypothetical protein